MGDTKKTKKSALGQFMTTNYRYILTGMYIPPTTSRIIEPFCGRGDLLAFIPSPELYIIECYDIDPPTPLPESFLINVPEIIERDTIFDPPIYADAFIITNPPYLARNKAIDKRAFDLYNTNDLYKCFLKSLTENNKCKGGIVIVPLNFWCSIRLADVELRSLFLNIYNIEHINVFEEQVFDDTSYTVCAFQFALKCIDNIPENECNISHIPITIFPSRKNIVVELRAENRFLIGGSIYTLPVSGRFRVWRRTAPITAPTTVFAQTNAFNTRIRAKCIDDSARNCIALELVQNIDEYVDRTPLSSARTYAALAIDPPIDEALQEQVVVAFNTLLQNHRSQFHSLFMSNFRESKDVARKRITFDLVYRIIGHVLDNIVPE